MRLEIKMGGDLKDAAVESRAGQKFLLVEIQMDGELTPDEVAVLLEAANNELERGYYSGMERVNLEQAVKKLGRMM